MLSRTPRPHEVKNQSPWQPSLEGIVRTWWRSFLGVVLLISVGCKPPHLEDRQVRWQSGLPGICLPEDRFTLKVLELDEAGAPISKEQWDGVLAAAEQAEDIALFIHGWRRDARDIGSMEGFLKIYRGAFECLSQRDVEGTEACRALHGFCHPAAKSSKLVILILWNGRSGPFGFKGVQRRANGMGPGLLKAMEAIHQRVHEKGTFIAMGHSLGGTALASALNQGVIAGHIPVDGVLLVASAFDEDLFPFTPVPRAAQAEGGAFLLNLFNRRDGYLRLYRWLYGHPTAGERGLKGFPVTPGSTWVKEGRLCSLPEDASFGGSLFDAGIRVRSPQGVSLGILNMDVTGLVRGHTDIEDAATLRIYNRAATEMLFQILWDRITKESSGPPTTNSQPSPPAKWSASQPKRP